MNQNRSIRLAHWQLLFGILLFFFAIQSGTGPGYDSYHRLLMSRRILERGTVFYPSSPAPAFVETNRGWTTFYTMGQAIVYLPFDVLGLALSHLTDGKISREFPLRYVYCPLIGLAWFWSLCSLLMEFGLEEAEACVGTFLFLISTICLYYICAVQQEEPLAGILLALSLRYGLRWNRSARSADAFLCGLAGCTIFLVRPNGFFALLPVLGAIGFRFWERVKQGTFRGREFAIIGISVLLPFSIHVLFSYWRFGTFISMDYGKLSYHWHAFDPWIPLALLAGPGKGILVFSPALLFAVVGIRGDRSDHRWLWPASVLAMLTSLALAAFMRDPDGAWSWGARYQVHLLVPFAYPVWLGVRRCFGDGNRRWWVVSILAWGMLVNGAGFFADESLEYRQIEASPQTSRELITQVAGGQLMRRARNIADFLAAGAVAPTDHTPIADNNPNVWEVNLARQVPSLLFRIFVLGIGGLLLVLSLVLVRSGLYRLARTT